MNFNPIAFIENLPYMAEGMLCIIAVILIFIVITVILNAVTGKKK